MSLAIDNKYFERLAQAVIDGEDEDCLEIIKEGLENGLDPLEGIEKGLVKGIKKVGDDFAEEIVYLPELIMAADALKKGLVVLDEEIKAQGRTRKSAGKMVIGTVKGDIHDIGKSVVAAMLQAHGYDVIDLGLDIEPDAFVQAVIENDADCLGMSTLLTLTLSVMDETIKKFKEKGIRDKVKVIVGGCPVTQEFADEVGADAVGWDSRDAVIKVNKLLGVSS